HRELDARDLGGRDDVACHADDEEAAQALVEDGLRRRARIRTTEDDGEGTLTARKLGAIADHRLDAPDVLHEASIAFHQPPEGLVGVHDIHGRASYTSGPGLQRS